MYLATVTSDSFSDSFVHMCIADFFLHHVPCVTSSQVQLAVNTCQLADLYDALIVQVCKIMAAGSPRFAESGESSFEVTHHFTPPSAIHYSVTSSNVHNTNCRMLTGLTTINTK